MESHLPTTVLSTHPERPAICREGCEFDALIQLKTPPLAGVSVQRKPVAIAVVIDRSGSMAGPKLQAACAAAQQLVRQLTPTDRLSVISFDDQVRTAVPLSAPSEAAIAAIGRIRSGGQTALFDGWRVGMEALLQAEELTGHQKRVVLLTDGQANVGLTRRSEVAPLVGQANEQAISTSCIGLGEDYEERLLTAMAEAGAGNLVHLTSPQQLEAVFAAELEGLNLTLGRDLRLRLCLGVGVKLKQIHNPLEPGADGWIQLGALQAGITPTLAVRLQIAPGDQSEEQVRDLLTVEAQWINADDEPEQREAVMRLPVVEFEEWRALPVDPDVQREVLLQQTAKQRRRAIEELDQGDSAQMLYSVQAALHSLDRAQGSPEIDQERKLLAELLELISTNKLSLARKVMGTQSFMRARGRKLRNQEGRDDL